MPIFEAVELQGERLRRRFLCHVASTLGSNPSNRARGRGHIQRTTPVRHEGWRDTGHSRKFVSKIRRVSATCLLLPRSLRARPRSLLHEYRARACLGGMAPRTLGKFSVDDKVEVLSDEKGFSGAWALATVIGITRGRLLVEFSRFVDEAGVAIREKVPPHRLRHVPLYPARFNVHIGLRVEGYLHDCWWPGEVVEMHARKGTRIQFDDGDAAWLVRSRVRPLLRRAPDPGGLADAVTAEAWKLLDA